MMNRAQRPVAFEVIRNGRRLCVAGLAGKRGVLSAFLHVASRSEAQEFMLDVGALEAESNEMLTWARRTMRVGDEIVIRVVEDSKPSRIKSRSQIPELEAKLEVPQLRQMAKKFGYKLVRVHPGKS